MTNRTKIIIAILIIVAIIITIWGIISVNSTKNKSHKEQDEIDNMMEYFEESSKHNETDDIETENNLVTVNSMSENVQENNLEKQNDSSTEQQEIIGKEEQESNTGNIEINNAQKAIELAKEEWAISVDFYNFQAELQSDGTYKVTVSNKTTTAYITSYIVNIETNTVVEE